LSERLLLSEFLLHLDFRNCFICHLLFDKAGSLGTNHLVHALFCVFRWFSLLELFVEVVEVVVLLTLEQVDFAH